MLNSMSQSASLSTWLTPIMLMQSREEMQSREASRKTSSRDPVAAPQAVLTDSILLVDMTRPVPMEDFLRLHSESLRFEDVRNCYLDGGGGLQKVRGRLTILDSARPMDTRWREDS